jgi:hypothetical protein
MKAILFILLAFVGVARAQSVEPNPVQGQYAPFVVTLPAGGTVPMSATQVDFTKFWVISGSCAITTVQRFHAVQTGVACTGPSSFHMGLQAFAAPYCPGDGQMLVMPRLVLAVDGAVFYDQPLGTIAPTVCWVTPALPPVMNFTYPVLTIDNSAQAQPSASFTYELVGYLMANYTFTSDTPTVVCDRLIRLTKPNRWTFKYVEVGTKCTGVVPANSVAHVTVR